MLKLSMQALVQELRTVSMIQQQSRQGHLLNLLCVQPEGGKLEGLEDIEELGLPGVGGGKLEGAELSYCLGPKKKPGQIKLCQLSYWLRKMKRKQIKLCQNVG